MGITGVMLCDTRMRTRFAFILIAVAIAYPARAVLVVDEAADLARLALEVQRAEDIRAVKRLQISYAHFAQFGLWSDMASLFTSDAETVYGADRLKGRDAIHRHLLTAWGNGREPLPTTASTARAVAS